MSFGTAAPNSSGYNTPQQTSSFQLGGQSAVGGNRKRDQSCSRYQLINSLLVIFPRRVERIRMRSTSDRIWWNKNGYRTFGWAWRSRSKDLAQRLQRRRESWWSVCRQRRSAAWTFWWRNRVRFTTATTTATSKYNPRAVSRRIPPFQTRILLSQNVSSAVECSEV